jgi:general secretion pathway protein L
MINDFLNWWGRQLLTLLPDAMRGRGFDAGRSILISLVSAPGVVPEAVEVSLPAAASETVLLDDDGVTRLRGLRAHAPRAPVRLRLRTGSLLERDVTLPAAVERSLGRVLQYEMNRLTPFAAAETIWGWKIIRRERAQARLHLRLTLAPRGPVASVLAKLEAAGAAPTLLEAAARAAGEGWRRIDLSGQGEKATASRPALHLGLALCGVLCLALVAVPFVRQSIEMMRLNARIAALEPWAAEAAHLRGDIEARAAGGSVVAAARDQVGDPLRALAAVTDALPDNSWLTDFVMQQRRLEIAGESRSAVQLIGRLSASPVILDPAFAAPVTRDDSGHMDVFSISAALAP